MSFRFFFKCDGHCLSNENKIESRLIKIIYDIKIRLLVLLCEGNSPLNMTYISKSLKFYDTIVPNAYTN